MIKAERKLNASIRNARPRAATVITAGAVGVAVLLGLSGAPGEPATQEVVEVPVGELIDRPDICTVLGAEELIAMTSAHRYEAFEDQRDASCLLNTEQLVDGEYFRGLTVYYSARRFEDEEEASRGYENWPDNDLIYQGSLIRMGEDAAHESTIGSPWDEGVVVDLQGDLGVSRVWAHARTGTVVVHYHFVMVVLDGDELCVDHSDQRCTLASDFIQPWVESELLPQVGRAVESEFAGGA
jgi:hypothetical protein